MHHIVVAPKKHIASMTTVTARDEECVRQLLRVVQSVASDLER